MARKNVTDFGWEIKRKLIERKMDQKEFCRLYNIPEPRLSNLIYGTRKAVRYREKIARILQIDDSADGRSGNFEKQPRKIHRPDLERQQTGGRSQ